MSDEFDIEPDQVEEFWKRVDKSPGQGPNGDCWQWTGFTKNKEGYGGFHLRQIHNNVNTHKLSFVITHNFRWGEIPKGVVIRHLCNNHRCVRPEHLRLGTHKDNSQDMVKAGNSLRGTKNPKSIYNDDLVRRIRELWSTGEYSMGRLADTFGGGVDSIRRIVLNLTWVDDSYVPPDISHSRKYSSEVLDEVRRRLESGESGLSISKDLGISASHITNIKHNGQRKNG